MKRIQGEAEDSRGCERKADSVRKHEAKAKRNCMYVMRTGAFFEQQS
jgi:hypothetical protein